VFRLVKENVSREAILKVIKTKSSDFPKYFIHQLALFVLNENIKEI